MISVRLQAIQIGMIAFGLGLMAGCQSSQEDATSSAKRMIATGSAQQLIQNCLSQYRNVRTYQDRASVTLRYPASPDASSKANGNAGRMIEEVSPLRIAFEAPNRIAIEAYLTKVTSTADQLHAIVGDHQSRPVGNQRLNKPLPATLSHEWLFSDPLLERYLSGGIVGAPMQLDLLWSSESLEKLFLASNTTLSLLEPAEIDGRRCHRVVATTKDSESVLWIDAQDALLRRFQLPTSALVADVLVGVDPRRVELSIDFKDARLNAPIDWQAWQLPNQSNDLKVRRWVMPPPALASDKIGQTTLPFDLRDESGSTIMDSQARKKPVSVLCWITDHSGCQENVQQLMATSRQLEQMGIGNDVEIFLVWATQADAPTSPTAVLKQWKCTLPCGVDPGEIGRDRFGVSEAPTLVILDKQARIQWFEERANPHLAQVLPNLLLEIVRGENLASKMLADYHADQARFAAQLHLVSTDVSQAAMLPPIKPFEPLLSKLRSRWTWPSQHALLAAASFQSPRKLGKNDLEASWVTVDQQGKIHLLDWQGQAQLWGQLNVDQVKGASSLQVLPQTGEGPVAAIVAGDVSRFWLVSEQPGLEAKSIPLPSGEHVDLAQWANSLDRNAAPLLVATNKNRILMVEPNTDQFLSGESPKSVVAFAPTLKSDGNIIEWNAILEGGEVHALILPSKSDRMPHAKRLDDGIGQSTRAESTFSLTGSSSRTAQAEELVKPKRKLGYEPLLGDWRFGRDALGAYHVGLGMIEGKDPAAMLSDKDFRPLWHFPLAITQRSQSKLLGSSNDPTGQQLFWLIQSPASVLHLVRADGQLSEPMSWGQRIVGAGLSVGGEKFWLTVALDKSIQQWELILPPTAPAIEQPK